MVSFVNSSSDTVHKRRRADGSASPRVQQRHRKQKLTARLGDSGFEEDLGPPAVSPPARTPRDPDTAAGGQLSSWFLQYGDIGYRVQREREAHFYPCKSLARQPQLTPEARCKLVSWLIPVHRHFRLSFECCCLAVSIADRFLASTPVSADCFQLLGVTALLLASKQVEVCSPSVGHLLSMCCDAFTKEQLCNLECLVLVRLHFRLAAPTVAFFLDYYSHCCEAATARPHASRLSCLARKMCELTLADYAFNEYPPSLTASCALTLAREMLRTKWEGHERRDSLMDDASSSATDSLLSRTPTGSHFHPDHSLAQECKNNLRLLASLNPEALDIM